MLATKPLDLYRNLVPTGMLSVVSPWSFAVVLSVIVPAALLPPPIFLESGSQTSPAEIFGLCGRCSSCSGSVGSLAGSGAPPGHAS